MTAGRLSDFEMRLFAAIADRGGLTAAARALGLTKSTVSRDLARLEDRLGLRLIQRTTRRLHLTDAGELLATHARRVAEELDQAEASLMHLREDPSGPLRVTAPYAVVRHLLAPHLMAFLARYPGIALSIDPSVRIVDLVEEGIDLALRIGEVTQPSAIVRKIVDVEVILVAAPAYLRAHGAPANPSELQDHVLIDMVAGMPRRQWRVFDSQGQPQDVAVNAPFAINEPSIVIDMARRAAGIAPVPAIYMREALARGDLARVLPDHTLGRRPLNAVYPSRRYLAPKVRVFIDFLLEIIDASAPAV